MQLCSVGQLFNAAFNEGWNNLCYSGWFSDTYDGKNAGWFNADGSCGSLGWNSWTPAKPGAHCCSESLTSVTPQSCAAFDGAICLAQGDKIIADDASLIWCASGECDIATCCQDFVAAPLYVTLPETWPIYVYSSADEANEACKAKHPDLQLCTKTQVRDIAETQALCVSGWWVTEKNAENEITGTDRGWYVGEEFKDSCGGTAGERTWKSGDGTGPAHCCVPSYKQSGYRVLGDYGDYSTATAEVYCKSQGYTFELCSKDQLETVSRVEMPNVCMSGYLTDAHGWWQGDVPNSGCGTGNSFNTWVHPASGAHCCLSYVQAPPVIPITDYGIMPDDGNYRNSPYTSGPLAEAACIARGYDMLCTMGQQAFVEENPAMYGNIACKSGWIASDGGYDYGFWGACGAPGAWNGGWWPPNGNPVAHCCFANVDEIVMTQYPYKNGDWNTYATYDAAAAQCAGEYSLCTKAQLQLIATEGVEYNGVFQKEDNICRLGYTMEGEKGWWQGRVGSCGSTLGWRTFGDASTAATYHCCLPFEAIVETTDPPKPISFVKQPERGYPYVNADEALSACKAIHQDYNLCADYEVKQAAQIGVTGNEVMDGVDPQDLCYTAWFDPERSEEHTYGWYVSAVGTCGGSEGWRKWLQGGTNAGAFCCYSPNFDSPSSSASPTSISSSSSSTSTTTSSTSTSTSSTSTTTTEVPTTTTTSIDFSNSLPSSVALPSDCVDTGFTIDGFPSVIFCSSAGTVYLNGRNTCVPSEGGDESAMFNTLQQVWEDEWYLAANGCTGGKTYDEATEDQLWITNAMCSNLEEEINELESSTADYMDGWTQSVIDLVNAQKDQFNSETQKALEDYLASLGD